MRINFNPRKWGEEMLNNSTFFWSFHQNVCFFLDLWTEGRYKILGLVLWNMVCSHLWLKSACPLSCFWMHLHNPLDFNDILLKCQCPWYNYDWGNMGVKGTQPLHTGPSICRQTITQQIHSTVIRNKALYPEHSRKHYNMQESQGHDQCSDTEITRK